MHDIFIVLLKAFFWIEKRFRSLMQHPAGRVGVFVVFILVATVAATQNVYAQDQGPPQAGAGPAQGPAKNPDTIDQILLWFADIAIMVATGLSKLVIMLIHAMLPIMTYNNFTNSPIVNAGWSIVRDTVNMFFVIVLIVIAFGTIFGHKKFQWQQQVPHLLIFAIVINFSKTLAGIMIDFGQVIMLTFANALNQIAAGNFVQLLGFTEIYSIGVNNPVYQSTANGTGSGVQPYDFFFAGMAAVFMMLIIVATMLIMLAILIYRVIMLWVLIVIAPLAWFVGGAKDIVQSEAYAEWWKRFKCLVAIGPVLTFFLWLTLAVAGAGNIAAKSGFDVSAQGELANPGGIINKIFELDRFMSFIIAIAMLFAGFEAAKQICSSMPEIGSVGKRAQNLARGSAKAVASLGKTGAGLGLKAGAGAGRLGLRAGRAGGRFAGRELGARMENTSGLRLLTTQGRANKLREMAANSGTGAIGRTKAAMFEKMAGKQEGKLRERVGAAGKAFEGLSNEGKMNQLKRFAESPPSTVLGKQKAAALFQELMGDKSAMAGLAADGKDKELWKQFGGLIEKNARGDKESQDKIAAFKKRNPHFTGNVENIQRSDVENLSDQALTDASVREKLERLKYTDPKTGIERSEADDLRAGKYDDRARKLFTAENGEGALMENMSGQQLLAVGATVLAAQGSDAALSRAADQAMSNGEEGRLEEVLNQLVEQMKKGTPEQAFNAQSRFDNLTAHLTASAEGKDKATQARMETLTTKARGKRSDALGLGGTWKGGKFFEEHGTVPLAPLAANPEQFVRRSFGNASKGRIENAKKQMNDQLAPLTEQREQAKTELDAIMPRAQQSLRYQALAAEKAKIDAMLPNIPGFENTETGKPIKKKSDELQAQMDSIIDLDEEAKEARKKFTALNQQVEGLTKGIAVLGTITPLEDRVAAQKEAAKPKPRVLTEREQLLAGMTDEEREVTGNQSRILRQIDQGGQKLDRWVENKAKGAATATANAAKAGAKRVRRAVGAETPEQLLERINAEMAAEAAAANPPETETPGSDTSGTT